MDQAMVDLYLKSVEELEEIKTRLAPLEEQEATLQEKFAPIRQELKAVCKQITAIKKETGYGVIYSRVMKMKPKYERGQL